MSSFNSSFDIYFGFNVFLFTVTNPYLISDLPIKDLKSLKIQEYYNKLANDNISIHNIKKSHKLLRQFFNYVEKEGYILKNPCINVSLPKIIKTTETVINER